MSDLETRFLELLEQSPLDINAVFTLLGPEAKERADTVTEYLDMLDESLKDSGLHGERWSTARWRLEHIQAVKTDWEELWNLFLECHPDHPTLPCMAKNMIKEYRKSPRKTLTLLEELMNYLPKTVVKFKGKPGMILDFNDQLAVFKVRLDSGQMVSVPFRAAARFLTILSQRSSEGKSEPDIQQLRDLAESDPREFLTSVCKDPHEPLNLDDLNVMLKGILSPEEIKPWWESVLKRLPFISLQKGNRRAYRLARDKEEALREADTLTGKDRLTFIIQNASSFENLKPAFLERLKSFLRNPDPALAYRAYKAVSKIFPEESIQIDELFNIHPPESLFPALTGFKERLEILDAISNPHHLLQAFKAESHPECLNALWKKIGSKQAIQEILSRPSEAPGAFLFLMAKVGEDHLMTDLAKDQSNYLLKICLEAYFTDRFSPFIDNLNLLWGPEGGAVYLIKNHLKPDEAGEFLSDLDESAQYHKGFIQHNAIKNQLLMVFPDLTHSKDTLWCTEESLKKKQDEFAQIMNSEIPKTRKAVSEAAAMGDLRENFEYKSGRERYEHLQVLASRLSQDIERARVIGIPPVPVKKIVVGTRATLGDGSGNDRTITLLGPWESDPDRDIYSYESEVGKAFLDQAEGDEVEALGSTWNIQSIDPWQ